MSKHALDRDVLLDRLAVEIAAAHGWTETPVLTARAPGQTDEDGEPLPGVLVIDRDADPQKVADVIAVHVLPAEPVAPLTDDEITALRSMLATR
jgi:hypothetical protein